MKKRILSLILTFVLLVSSIPMAIVPVSAAVYSGTCGADGDNLTWSFDSEAGILTVSGEGDMLNFKMSSPADWYQYRSSIKEIVIEDGVTSIGSYAFNKCVAVEKIIMGKNLTSVKNGAFIFCTNVSSVIIEDIATWFNIEFDLNANPLSLGCTLENGAGVVYETVTVPKNIEKINNYAFEEYKHLKEFVIPEGVKSIGERTFYGCDALEKVTLGESITSISKSAFEGCTSLKAIKLPRNLEALESKTFSGCGALEFINIPSGIEEIGTSAFSSCSSLKEVIIPKSVTKISSGAFSDCASLETVYYAGNEEAYDSIVIDGSNDALGGAEVICEYLASICGDVNGDGKINTKDVLFLRKHLGGIEELENEMMGIRSDVTGDGNLNTKDILAIRKYLGSLITEFDAVANQK